MNISFIGSGHVAWRLAKFFKENGHRVEAIYNRTADSGFRLAQEVDAKYISWSAQIKDTSDVLIIAVSDDAIPEVVDHIDTNSKAIVVHTSGATPISVLDKFENFGVIYPPQSLRKEVDSPLTDIPFAVEGSNDEIQQEILHLMQSIAPKSFTCDSQQRLTLHVGAVFVNNFVNALYQIGFDLLKEQKLDFDLLRPIILETALKVQKNNPKDVQTGPAARNDKKTINRHLELLSDMETTKEIYQQLTSFLVKQSLKP